MMFFTRQFRPDHLSMKERRLCYDFKSSIGDSYDSISRTLGEGMYKVSEGANACFNVIKGCSKTLANDIFNVWRLDPRAEDLKNGQLMTIAEFANTAPPLLQALVEQLFRDKERPTLSEITLIFSQQQWLSLFSDPNNFYERSLPRTPKATLRDGVKGVFASMDDEHRKLFYFQYVEGIIPLAVRDDPRYSEIFGEGDKLLRADEMVKHLTEINGSMGMMLGLQSPPDPALRATDTSFNIAKEGLMHHYWRDGKRDVESEDGSGRMIHLPFSLDTTMDRDEDGKLVKRGEGLKPQFTQDVERVVGHNLFMGGPDDIRRRLGPSFLKGALDLSFGVMEPDDLPPLQAYIGNKTADKTTNKLQTSVNVRARTNVIRREQMRNAETLGDTFSNMSGMEKIALVSIAAYLLSTSKTARGAVGALGVLYFGQKFLLKQNDPINEVWMPMIQGLVKKSTDFVRPGFQRFGIEFDHEQYSDAEMQSRIGLMSRFLSDNARADLNTSVEGFTILADMKLSELAQYFTMSSDGSLAAVRYWDPNFKRLIKEKVAKHGLDPATAERFFGGADPEIISDPVIRAQFEEQMLNRHLREAGSGLASVFYMCAVREPRNKVPLRIIEYFRGTMGYGSYEDLPVGAHYAEYIDEGGYKVRELVYPRDLYVQLVREGQELASGKQTSLLQFVSSELGADTSPVMLAKAAPKSPTPSRRTVPVSLKKRGPMGPTDDLPDAPGATDDLPTSSGPSDAVPPAVGPSDDAPPPPPGPSDDVPHPIDATDDIPPPPSGPSDDVPPGSVDASDDLPSKVGPSDDAPPPAFDATDDIPPSPTGPSDAVPPPAKGPADDIPPRSPGSSDDVPPVVGPSSDSGLA